MSAPATAIGRELHPVTNPIRATAPTPWPGWSCPESGKVFDEEMPLGQKATDGQLDRHVIGIQSGLHRSNTLAKSWPSCSADGAVKCPRGPVIGDPPARRHGRPIIEPRRRHSHSDRLGDGSTCARCWVTTPRGANLRD